MPVRIPSPQDIDLTEKRLQTHAKKHFVGKYGVKEIRARFKNNFMLLEVIKHQKEGMFGKMFNMGSVKTVGKLARLVFQGPNKWKFFIYNYDNNRYESYKDLREGTIEDCLDLAAKVFIVK